MSRKAAKIRTDGRPHETNGGGRSSEAMRDAPRPASGRRDALKELRDRGGVRSSRQASADGPELTCSALSQRFDATCARNTQSQTPAIFILAGLPWPGKGHELRTQWL